MFNTDIAEEGIKSLYYAIMTHILLAIIYAAFISLGLPDALLGSAWPTMYREFSVPVSYSGVIFMIIAGGSKPIASNANEDGRAQNRRVEITVME